MEHDLLHSIALTCIQGVGDFTTKQLISYCGSAKDVFNASKASLTKIPGIGEITIEAIKSQKESSLSTASSIIEKAEKQSVDLLFYTMPTFPRRLKHYEDSPCLLYAKGNTNYNHSKTVAIVGTRKASLYGKTITEKIVSDLKKYDVQIISGLAYGIDIEAHKACLKNNISTIAVMANGIDKIYPSVHKKIAHDMQEYGAIITENTFGTYPDAPKFPARNRIIAGMSDVTIVVEAASSGGALITANIANNYSKEVYAVPGSLENPTSEGCHKLIQNHLAHLFVSVENMAENLGWNDDTQKITIPKSIPDSLSEDEKTISQQLIHTDGLMIDELSRLSSIPINKVASILLSLELQGCVRSLPGKKYAWKK